ncbi:unnamed protein product [Vitrella brassicaformis CCMP3155]|uniref:Uncharacterized protein n=1 Tax=Vitrella brassicaformis (strain CCMP3155) TaxID=1169540 RepID=A0A0G4EU62_VITBC|nr:unnamed protein product [Vitrella brassicaformis CCMP3155]|eukprot:CEM01947.1 unnamed protein product [Vitrella brassicaformis CCMP3155]
MLLFVDHVSRPSQPTMGGGRPLRPYPVHHGWLRRCVWCEGGVVVSTIVSLSHPHTHGALRHRHLTLARPPSAKRSSITALWPSSGHWSAPHCVRKPIYSDSPLRPSTIHSVSLTPHCVTKPICYSLFLPHSAHAAATLRSLASLSLQ